MAHDPLMVYQLHPFSFSSLDQYDRLKNLSLFVLIAMCTSVIKDPCTVSLFSLNEASSVLMLRDAFCEVKKL